MDATCLYLADCVGVIVLPISRIIIASAYKELIARARERVNSHNIPIEILSIPPLTLSRASAINPFAGARN